MAPDKYFISILPLLFDPFKPTNGIQSNQNMHKSWGHLYIGPPSNFEILTNVTSGY